MTENFIKENDYTISVVNESKSTDSSGYSFMYRTTSLTRTFNFLSAQVTVIARDSIFQSRSSEAGGSSSISTQMIIQNFSDIQAFGEIKLMHQKLVELGGKPPKLEDILPIIDKKVYPLRPE